MKTSIARRLIGINRSFYNSFASPWSESRVPMHKGIVRALKELHPLGHLLDLGCGDGRVGFWAAENRETLQLTSYTGADFSSGLLRQHGAHETATPANISFVNIDMTASGWAQSIRESPPGFNSAICFSALHHIPGPQRRLKVLQSLYSLLESGARCAISAWQLTHVPRLTRKIRPWSEAGIHANQVEPNDYLVDWKMGGTGLRYVHEFSEAELYRLCQQAGFQVLQVYRSDGQTGDMGLYIILEA